LKSSPSEPLPAEFADALARVRLGRLASEVIFLPTTGSTNDVAAACALGWSEADERGLEGLVVLADAQTAGRGRHGHVWASPAGTGLYVSVLLMPGKARVDPMRATMLVTLTAGVGIAEGIEQATGLRADLKWPNDLLVGRRKLAGILAEATGVPRRSTERAEAGLESVVVGFGINVNPAAFPSALADRATSVESELGRAVDRPAVLAGALGSLAARYDDLLEGRFDAILDAWRRRAPASVGAKVTWHAADGPASGVTAGIDDHGALLVRVGERVERIVAGEVVWP
jgi:BirA family biotin operon repressor/biotin-[acetyl-CoA-carboxylase] ligase